MPHSSNTHATGHPALDPYVLTSFCLRMKLWGLVVFGLVGCLHVERPREKTALGRVYEVRLSVVTAGALGTPVRDTALTFELPGQYVLAGRTDASGALRLDLPCRISTDPASSYPVWASGYADECHEYRATLKVSAAGYADGFIDLALPLQHGAPTVVAELLRASNR